MTIEGFCGLQGKRHLVASGLPEMLDSAQAQLEEGGRTYCRPEGIFDYDELPSAAAEQALDGPETYYLIQTSDPDGTIVQAMTVQEIRETFDPFDTAIILASTGNTLLKREGVYSEGFCGRY
ncbi:MAG: hypothetical protein ABH879_06480 [archaeon]